MGHLHEPRAARNHVLVEALRDQHCTPCLPRRRGQGRSRRKIVNSLRSCRAQLDVGNPAGPRSVFKTQASAGAPALVQFSQSWHFLPCGKGFQALRTEYVEMADADDKQVGP